MQKIRKGIFMFLIGLMLCVSNVHAASLRRDVIIPVVCTGKCIVTLTPSDASGEQTMTCNNEKGQFKITVEKPGNYTYSLHDQTGKTYQVMVVVTNGENGTLDANVISTLDGKHKEAIQFGKQAKSTSQPIQPAMNVKTPKPHKNKHLMVLTGDSTHIAIWVVCASIAALGIILLIRYRRREE